VAKGRKRKRKDPSLADPLVNLMKRTSLPPSKNAIGLVPIGRTTSRASFREGSMSKMGGRGWRLRTGYMGSGAVVFPDTDASAKAFLKSIGRPLTAADRDGWFAYTQRISMAPDAAERAWKRMMKPSLRPKLDEVLRELRDVFESTSWWGFSVPHLFGTKQGSYKMPTPHDNKPAKNKAKQGVPNTPIPSFPYHTKAARQVYKKALELIRLYPMDNPTQIMRRAISAVDMNPVMDLTPEDEKLLRMAIEYAQQGPAGEPSKIGGAPGGPFNSTGKTRGAP
jgi:hypothetical protein